jgi:hypothetical protein
MQSMLGITWQEAKMATSQEKTVCDGLLFKTESNVQCNKISVHISERSHHQITGHVEKKS